MTSSKNVTADTRWPVQKTRQQTQVDQFKERDSRYKLTSSKNETADTSWPVQRVRQTQVDLFKQWDRQKLTSSKNETDAIWPVQTVRQTQVDQFIERDRQTQVDQFKERDRHKLNSSKSETDRHKLTSSKNETDTSSFKQLSRHKLSLMSYIESCPSSQSANYRSARRRCRHKPLEGRHATKSTRYCHHPCDRLRVEYPQPDTTLPSPRPTWQTLTLTTALRTPSTVTRCHVFEQRFKNYFYIVCIV